MTLIVPLPKTGWSSRRGRARHLVEPYVAQNRYYSLCGAPIRISSDDLTQFSPPTVRRLKALEVCDHCQAFKRRRK